MVGERERWGGIVREVGRVKGEVSFERSRRGGLWRCDGCDGEIVRLRKVVADEEGGVGKNGVEVGFAVEGKKGWRFRGWCQ